MALRAIVFEVGETLLWGYLFDAPPRAIRIHSLAELPEALGD